MRYELFAFVRIVWKLKNIPVDPHLVRDGLIAATALVHGMTVVTRNVSDFELTGVAVLDPWGWAPVRSA